MELFVVGAAALVCAAQAIRAQRLLAAAVWLAGCSAATAIFLYGLGAPEVAVIELSVGAGLVTVLLVFAIGVSREETARLRSVVPPGLAAALVAASLALLAWTMAPVTRPPAPEPSFSAMLWQHRALDALVQVALIFAGILGVLGLLADRRAPLPTQAPAPEEAALRRS